MVFTKPITNTARQQGNGDNKNGDSYLAQVEFKFHQQLDPGNKGKKGEMSCSFNLSRQASLVFSTNSGATAADNFPSIG